MIMNLEKTMYVAQYLEFAIAMEIQKMLNSSIKMYA